MDNCARGFSIIECENFVVLPAAGVTDDDKSAVCGIFAYYSGNRLPVMYYRYLPSPLGPLLLAADEHGLHLVHMDAAQPWELPTQWQLAGNQLDEVARQLDEYFAGTREQFQVDLAPQGTAFQREVWAALQRIPYGTTCSYGDLAQQIKRPRAVRAVGTANGANPISIIVPCHRVIGSNGTLTGYAGGVERKQLLLELEGAWLI
ncbi:Methylated-DNA--protein-cysteine methyltransferase [compost metagenome]